MGIHIVIVGNGRIGRPTAYTLLSERFADEISLVDTKSGLSWAFGEELKHAAASLSYDLRINAYEKDSDVSGADLIVVCAGKARQPGTQKSRRNLVVENAEIIRYLAEILPQHNPGARFVIVSNPVDAMATLFKKVSKANFVIGTGDHPDTLRFRTKLAIELDVPVSTIEGFIGGEHGSAAYPLWSTVKINNVPLEDYLNASGKVLNKDAVVNYVRGVSLEIVNIVGATEYGPAAAFRDIIRSIIQDRGELYSVAVSSRLSGLPEEVNVSVPTHIGQHIGASIWSELSVDEQNDIIGAAKAIYRNYVTGLRNDSGSKTII